MPGQEIERLVSASCIVPKMLLHVCHKLSVYTNSLVGIQCQLPPLTPLLEQPRLYESATACHNRQATCIRETPAGLQTQRKRSWLYPWSSLSLDEHWQQTRL